MDAAVQPLADRGRLHDGDVHGGARHLDRQRRAAPHRRQPLGQQRSVDVGADQLPRLQRDRAAGHRLAEQPLRTQALPAGVHRDLHALPGGLLALLMVRAVVEDPPYVRDAPRTSIDYVGFGLMALWLATLQIVLDKGQEVDWFSAPWITWFSLVSVVSLVAFIVWELRSAAPIVDLRVLSNRNFAVGTALMGVMGAVLYASTALLPLFLQTLLGYPALDSGLAVSPRGIGAMLAMAVVGRLIGVIDTRALLTFGFVLLGISAFLLGHINLDIGMVAIVWPNVVTGLALGFLFVPLTAAAVGTLEPRQMGNATGLFNLMRNLGGSVGISMATTLIARKAQGHQAI